MNLNAMFEFILSSFTQLLDRGGAVMWVLLGLSLISAALAFERCWFWARTNHPGRQAMVERMGQLLRRGLHDQARQLARTDPSIYGGLVRRMLEEQGSPAMLVEAIEGQRPQLERFMPTLSTIITAAPMLGILGTVIGLMTALNLFGDDQAVTDPRLISPAIGESLLTTAAGLVVALMVLFPYNAFRSQIDRTLGRIESLAAAIDQGRSQVDRRA